MEINGITNITAPPRQASPSESAQSAVSASSVAAAGKNAIAAESLTQQAVTANSTKGKAENDSNDLNSALDKVKQFVGSATNELEFTVDKDLGVTVIKVIDRSTNETITQIPSEDMIQLAKALDKLQGILVRQKA
ncbi:flagellar protein FlaG [Propionivibrio dicarboxylicus]|uniref:Flagellar protein FlaG n=1 Tax=Propionivibrio dicarboxylicus TaxID=83767 RepID=A0A1G8HBN0_9RHOO|nr:flagellar protein FlaG [Propionivibrio dicarboxylicus]SDI03891.1 flagellar protein FlaG [Propionivibrio dicarboxylicus]